VGVSSIPNVETPQIRSGNLVNVLFDINVELFKTTLAASPISLRVGDLDHQQANLLNPSAMALFRTL
jgi:hypothetical protein